MNEPKFKIGDLVQHVTQAEIPNENRYRAQIVFRVNEIHIQTCYGGEQINYDVRGYDGAAIHAMRFAEPELVLYKPGVQTKGYKGALDLLNRAKEELVEAMDFELAAETRDLRAQLKKLMADISEKQQQKPEA